MVFLSKDYMQARHQHGPACQVLTLTTICRLLGS